MESETKAYRKL